MSNKYLIFFSFIFVSTLVFAQSTEFSQQNLLQNELNTISVFKKVAPYVVYVHRYRRIYHPAFLDYQIQRGTGSGFLWDKQGHIVTNFHVIQGARKIAVSLQNGKSISATIVGVAPKKDIAVLKLNHLENLPQGTSTPLIPIANSSQLLAGQKTIAIGNPFGLDHTLTTGIVSALGRRVPGIGGVTIRNMIQTDASINPGNSGGPLLNSQGQLIGMNTAIFSRSGASAGIGFAVPANDIKRIVSQLISNGRIKEAGIGIHLLPSQIAKRLAINGLIVAEVRSESPAEKAGLRGTKRTPFGETILGDIILEVNGSKVKSYDDLYSIMDKIKIGKEVTIKFLRDNKTHTVKLKTIDISE